MSAKVRSGIRTACIIAGCALILGALGLLIWQRQRISAGQKRADEAAAAIMAAIPSPYPAALEPRSINAMSALSINGHDYIGLIEMGAHGGALCVAAQGQKTEHCPYAYSGSIYNGTMIIIAASRKGQFDFYKNISVGDALFFTDMTGGRYSYAVSNIIYRESIDSALDAADAEELCIIIQNINSLNEYIIIQCGAAGV